MLHLFTVCLVDVILKLLKMFMDGGLKKVIKKILLSVIILIIVSCTVSSLITEFVYLSPNVNLGVLPFVNKTIEVIDEGIDYSIKLSSRNSKIRVLYKNAYGSGFLKGNPIPNDLDYSAGIYLGKYYYDGKNSLEIAQNLEDRMSDLEISFYSYVENLNNSGLYSNYSMLSSVIFLAAQKDKKIESMQNCINLVFNSDGDYIYNTVKQIDEKHSFRYPFLLGKDEILLENYTPIQLFTSRLSYSNDPADFLREVTVVLDFFADVVDVRTGKQRNIEIVSESFVGQKFQLSRRFFVPIVFVGESSANYLKRQPFLIDDEEYINARLLNYRRHLQEFSNLRELNERPVKMLKRILQCADLIEPVLDVKLIRDIRKTAIQNLKDKDIKSFNNYHAALGNLMQISQMPALYFSAQREGQITKIIESMRLNLDKISKNNKTSAKDIHSLFEFQAQIERNVLKVSDKLRLKEFSEFLLEGMDIHNKNVSNIFDSIVSDKTKLNSYIKVFNKVYEDAGFHKIDIYWLDQNTIGVSKDNFTRKFDSRDLEKLVFQNNLPKVHYLLMDSTKAPKMTVRYSVWVRYNPSAAEQNKWQEMRTKLIKDKQKFNIKRKFILKF